MVTTWELHFAAPRSPEAKTSWLETLERIKREHTELLMDFYDGDDEGVSVMVGDIAVFGDVMRTVIMNFQKLVEISVGFDSDVVSGHLYLENEERHKIEFPSSS